MIRFSLSRRFAVVTAFLGFVALLGAEVSTPAVTTTATATATARERTLLDAGWRFALGHAADRAKDFNHATGYFSYLAKTGFGDGPASPAFDDRGWRLLDLPHDWAVEAPFDGKASHSHGYKAIGPGFPERSVGWYRRRFDVPASDLGRRLRIELDGAYRNARVFVNGFFCGEEPSGTIQASYDISDYLNYGGENVVVVRVDASMEEGWYYEGAGIYRHVWLTKTSPLHVARHGTAVTTDLGRDGAASVTIATEVEHEGRTAANYVIEQILRGPDGAELARSTVPSNTATPGATTVHRDTWRVAKPQLWSLRTPQLHTVTTRLLQDGAVVDEYVTRFGIRTVRFDPDTGFFLNGERVTIKGTNNHQDHAGVGVALPDALQEFRLRCLLAMGSNTYRTSHHPPTPELLDACDRLGVLVIDETRLMGTNAYHLGQLEAMMRRDRNHPSVILWSLGNEEWGIESNIKGARITTTMQDFARRLDPSRITTVAISGGWGGSSATVLAAGVNYIKQGNTDDQHARFPKQIILGTEETTTQQTRGIYVDDRPHAHLAPVADGSSGYNAEIGWQHYAARPWAAGVCYWTGFDYRGESTPFSFPAISSQFGILDTCGFPKDGFHYLRAWWQDETVLHVFPHWNWPGREGQPIEVRAHSNCDEVELWLNGASLGRQTMPRNGHLAWTVPYSPGALEARGYRAGKEIAKTRVETTGAPAQVRLTPDRKTITADGRAAVVFTVDVRDAEGRLVPTADSLIAFTIRGGGKIIGVGNGDPSSHEADRVVESVETRELAAWQAPEASVTTGTTVYEATFDLPFDTAAQQRKTTLLLNALGPKTTTTLNGRVLFTDADASVARTELTLAQLDLQPTGNLLRIEATKSTDWGEREKLRQFSPAAWRIETAAAPWKRSVFNGLAQIIVQSNGRAEAIVLEASSDGLKSAQSEIAIQR